MPNTRYWLCVSRAIASQSMTVWGYLYTFMVGISIHPLLGLKNKLRAKAVTKHIQLENQTQQGTCRTIKKSVTIDGPIGPTGASDNTECRSAAAIYLLRKSPRALDASMKHAAVTARHVDSLTICL